MRCFIAVDLPKEAQERLAKIEEQIKRFEIKANFIKPEQLHLTIRFLGEVSDFKMNQIKGLLKEITIKKFKARLNTLGVFPSESFIRVVWINLEPGKKFQEIHELIDKKLESIKIKPDPRFESHVTLARIKWLKDRAEFIEKLKKIKVEPLEFNIESLKLKKSTLTKEGPIYEDIIEIKFED
ncbi:MAG: RNA 2',3'-cyclic phosphodiesterase [Candidatus Pacearchaeota archaeon]